MTKQTGTLTSADAITVWVERRRAKSKIERVPLVSLKMQPGSDVAFFGAFSERLLAANAGSIPQPKISRIEVEGVGRVWGNIFWGSGDDGT